MYTGRANQIMRRKIREKLAVKAVRQPELLRPISILLFGQFLRTPGWLAI